MKQLVTFSQIRFKRLSVSFISSLWRKIRAFGLSAAHKNADSEIGKWLKLFLGV